MCHFHGKIFKTMLSDLQLYRWMESEEKVKEAVNHLIAISSGCKFYVRNDEHNNPNMR